jgi:hypothetical protein
MIQVCFSVECKLHLLIFSVDLIYPNGLSCSMPEELQEPMMRTIPGLEQVKMLRPAYGVEYDHVDPRELTCKLHKNAISCVTHVLPSDIGNKTHQGNSRFCILSLSSKMQLEGSLPRWPDKWHNGLRRSRCTRLPCRNQCRSFSPRPSPNVAHPSRWIPGSNGG